MSNVLPCPFCGEPPYVATEIDPYDWWYVACQTPGCIFPVASGHTSIESAIAKWNRRPEGTDSTRLDWIARNGISLRQDPTTNRWFLVAPYHTNIECVDSHTRFESARAAIDAAITGEAQ